MNNNPGSATAANWTTAAGLNGGAAATLIKTGSGDLVLTASNIYTGPTIISAGTLQLGNSTGNGALTATATAVITDNGTLVFDNTGTTTQGLQFTRRA